MSAVVVENPIPIEPRPTEERFVDFVREMAGMVTPYDSDPDGDPSDALGDEGLLWRMIFKARELLDD